MKNSTLKTATHLALITLLIITSINSFGQGINKPGSPVAGLQSINNPGDQAEATYINKIVSEERPAIAFIDGQMFESDGTFQIVTTDIQSYNMMLSNTALFHHAEMLTIRIESFSDLDASLSIPDLNILQELRYVRLLVLFDICENNNNLDSCIREKLSKYYQSFGARRLTVFYTLSIPN
jgi:hypothetical protein